MRGLRRRNGGQWRGEVERRVRITEPKVRRRASYEKSGLMLLGEQVANATTR
jgi:hypothetical protein